jgi:adenosylmethionine---8-amino-7-oxononanoate aminotransferase
MSDLLARDARHLWHPYTQHGLEAAPLPVRAAKGALLTLSDGRELVDAISSWWTCLHGHGRAELIEAMAEQAAQLDHVLFAGATHEPAVALAEALLPQLPEGLTRLFYSDDGSTAVEVALKLAFQAQERRGEGQRRLFVALEGGYHGDTFGAMAVGDPDPFFLPFEPLLFAVRRVPPDSAALEALLAAEGRQIAALIVEPLIQGAAGMRLHSARFLQDARELCDRHGIFLIADEVMTGFGRSGALFACRRAGIRPDLMTLAKGLTGGLLPLAATAASEAIFGAFVSPQRSRAFFHGHSFTAHPIGCAVALRSLQLCLEEDVPARLEAIGQALYRALAPVLQGDARVENLRQMGGLVAFELRGANTGVPGYLSDLSLRLRQVAIQQGVLLRPLGQTVYALPPACTNAEQIAAIARAMLALVDCA